MNGRARQARHTHSARRAYVGRAVRPDGIRLYDAILLFALMGGVIGLQLFLFRELIGGAL